MNPFDEVGAGLAGFLRDDLVQPSDLIVAKFCSLIIILVTAIMVRLAAVSRCGKDGRGSGTR
jgi:hypothetical protein